MKMHRIIAAAAGICALAAVSVQAYDMKELNVLIWDENQLSGLQQIADEWSKGSGVKVNITAVDRGTYQEKIEAGLYGEEMPDVLWVNWENAQSYMADDLLLPLDDFILEDSTMDISDFYEELAALYNTNDVQYALPKDHETVALVYNKAIFKACKTDTPDDSWSWDDVLEAASAITEKKEKDGVYGFAMDVSDTQEGWYNVLYDYGAEVVTADHTGSTIGSDQAKFAMETVRMLLEASVPRKERDDKTSLELFKEGKAAMILMGSWNIPSLFAEEDTSDYEFVLIPYGDANGSGKCEDGERRSCISGLGWAASYQVLDPEAAYSLIAWFCSEEGQKKQAELGVAMAGRRDASEGFADAFPGMDVTAYTKAEVKAKPYFRPYIPNNAEWETLLQQEGCFLDPWEDPSDPELMTTACDAAQGIIDAAIAAK